MYYAWSICNDYPEELDFLYDYEYLDNDVFTSSQKKAKEDIRRKQMKKVKCQSSHSLLSHFLSAHYNWKIF